MCWGNQADSCWVVCYLADNAARALGSTARTEADIEGCALRVEVVEEVLLEPATTALLEDMITWLVLVEWSEANGSSYEYICSAMLKPGAPNLLSQQSRNTLEFLVE